MSAGEIGSGRIGARPLSVGHMLGGYLSVGVAATFAYLGIAALLHSGLGLPTPLASLGAYLLASLLSYFGHKRLTFRSHGAHRTEAPRFAVLMALGLAISFGLPVLMEHGVGLGAPIAVAATAVAIPLANLLAMKLWVFRDEAGRLAVPDRAAQVALLASGTIVLVSMLDNAVRNYTHMDVSWLLLVAERVLAGEGLYTDIWESNPPFSILLYLPATLLAHASGAPAEFWAPTLAYAWMGGCLALCWGLQKRFALFPPKLALLLLPVTVGLLLLPLPAAFNQREFYGTVAALPMLMLAVARARGLAVPLGLALLVGSVASIAMLVKPHYAMAFALPYLFAAICRRTPRVLWAPEVLAAACWVLSYALLVVLVFPDYLTHVLPILADIYVTRRMGWTASLAGLGSCGLTIMLVWSYFATLAGRGQASAHMPFALAFVGCFLAFLIQGKGWDYHALPFFVTGGLAVTIAAYAAWPRIRAGGAARTVIGVVLLAFLGLTFTRTMVTSLERWRPSPALQAALAEGPPVRTIAVLGSHISLGNPLARIIGAQWIGRDNGDWLGDYALERLTAEKGRLDPALEARLRAYVEEAVRLKIADLHRKPDLIAVERDPEWIDFLMKDPRIARALSAYRPVARTIGVEYLRRAR